MKRRRRRRNLEEQVSQPPMTPMIDVIFQLMIYFMLTMHFKEVEGKLFSQLPKKEGLDPGHVSNPILQETRIYICAGGDILQHIGNKGEHEKAEKPNAECVAYVERNPIGKLYRTEDQPDKAAPNGDVYAVIGRTAAELYNMLPQPEDPTERNFLMLDADSEVPMEHIIGVVNACKREGLKNVEFVGNPRFHKYYGAALR